MIREFSGCLLFSAFVLLVATGLAWLLEHSPVAILGGVLLLLLLYWWLQRRYYAVSRETGDEHEKNQAGPEKG